MNLNARVITNLKLDSGKKKQFIYDTHRDSPKGFGVRLTAKKDTEAGKSYFFSYTYMGSQYVETIAPCSLLSLEEARIKARELILARRENGPLSKEKTSLRDGNIRDLIPAFLDEKSGLRSFKEIKGYMNRDVEPVLGPFKPSEVSRQIIKACVTKKAKVRPTASKRLLAYIKVFFEWCIQEGLIEANPAKGVKIDKSLVQEKPRTRTLTNQEIHDFWHGCNTASMSELAELALKLILVTGQRPSEVIEMHETEIQDGIWTIPASRRGKTLTTNIVPLSPLAKELIERAKSVSKGDGGYIFEPRRGEHLKVGSLSQAVLRDSVSLNNLPEPEQGLWRPHDLRRTCRTGMQECQVPLDIAERVLGHERGLIERTYATSESIDERKAALEAWERRLKAIIDGETPQDIKQKGRYEFANDQMKYLLDEVARLNAKLAELNQGKANV